MDGVEAIALLATAASKVYDKFCQVRTNREEVTSLQLRISLLINCLSDPRAVDDRGRGVLAGMRSCLEQAERLADDFAARSKDRVHQFVWSDRYAQRCAAINQELSGFVQLLGVASDRQQLDCLNEIQSQMEGRRKHDLDVGEQLRLLRQAVLECQRMQHDRKRTTASLHKIRDTLAKTASTAATDLSEDYGDGGPAPSSSVVADLEGLPPHLRELFLRPAYRSCLLDSRLLDFEESADDPSGAFGVVHRGTYLGRPVAAKVLLNKDPTAQAVKELLDETLLLKQYNFDYFATVYGVCIVGGGEGSDGGNSKKSPAVVMKRMDSDLFRFLHRNRSDRRDLRESLEWKLRTAITVAAAVEALHRLNVLHRDLKSLNILVSGDEAQEVCITDFGMARVRREAASVHKSRTYEAGRHETVGSYPWMAPEIMRAGKYTDKADVFSLGVILWEVFSWEEPWADAVGVRAVENAVCSGATLDVEEAGVPPGLASLLQRMWRANPRERPSAKEVVAELTDFQKRHVGGAAPPTPSPSVPSSPIPPASAASVPATSAPSPFPGPSEDLYQDDIEAGQGPPGPGATSEQGACCGAKPRNLILGLVFLVLVIAAAVGFVFARGDSSGSGGGGEDVATSVGTDAEPSFSAPVPSPPAPQGPISVSVPSPPSPLVPTISVSVPNAPPPPTPTLLASDRPTYLGSHTPRPTYQGTGSVRPTYSGSRRPTNPGKFTSTNPGKFTPTNPGTPWPTYSPPTPPPPTPLNLVARPTPIAPANLIATPTPPTPTLSVAVAWTVASPSPICRRLSVEHSCRQTLEVMTPAMFSRRQVDTYQFLMESYARDFGSAAGSTRVVAECRVARQGAGWRGRSLPAEYYLLEMEFDVRLDDRHGQENGDFSRLFETYVNDNLEKVTEDMSLFLPVIQANDVNCAERRLQC